MPISTPTNIANCNLWVKDDAGVYSDAGTTPATQGQGVYQWNDQSGSGNHLLQTTSGNRMKYDATHGLVVSEMRNAVNEYMALASGFAIDNQSFSVFFICEFNSVRTGIYAFASCLANSQFTCFFDFANNNSFLDKPYVYPQNVTAGPVPFTNLCLFGITGDGTNLKFYVNGVVVAGAAIGSGSTTNGTIFGSGTYPMMAAIKQAAMWTRAITALEVADLYVYAQGLGVIVSASATLQIVAAGDSLVEGQGATLNRSLVRLLNYPTYLMRSAGKGSTTIQAMVTDAAEIDQLVMAGKTNVLVVFAGTNDIAGGRTGAQAYGDLQTFCSGRRTAGFDLIVVCTMLPRAGIETQRVAYNSAIAAGFAGNTLDCDAIADLGADTNIGAAGANNNATYYDADTIHLNNTGYAVAAPIVQAAIDSVLVDTTPPTVLETSATNIDTTGLVFTAKFDGAVYNSAGAFGTDFSLTSNRGVSHTALEDGTFGDGDDSRQYDVFTNPVYKCETITLNCVSTEITDSAGIDGNHIVTFTGQAVVNNSTVICAVPSDLALTPYSTVMRIHWTANTEPVIGGYKLYRSTTLGGTYSLVATLGLVTTYLDTSLSNDQAYYYKITSLDLGSNESAKSSAANATPTLAAGDEPVARGGVQNFAFAGFGFGFDGDE